MTRLQIDRIAMKLHGVPVDVATTAIAGLDAEIGQRLQGRGFDAGRPSSRPGRFRARPFPRSGRARASLPISGLASSAPW